MDPNLLSTIIKQSEPHKSDKQPHGYCYVPASYAEAIEALKAGGMVETGPAAPDGSFPVRPTDAAIKWNEEANAAAHGVPQAVVHPQPAIPQPAPNTAQQAIPVANVQIEDNVPIPPTKRFGRAPSGGIPIVDQYPFATMNVGQSFTVPGTPGAEKPMHRTFSSIVSQANKKFHPRNFAIRAEKVNGTDGARIWRTEDLTGPRPSRQRKVKASEAPAPQPQYPQAGVEGFSPGPSPFAGGFAPPIGGQGGFPAPGAGPVGFPAPGGGFPAPGQAPEAPAGWGAAPAFPGPNG